MKNALMYGSLIVAASGAAGLAILYADAPAPQTGGLRSFEIVPLETVSETSSNASIGDLNGDGHPDIVLVKGRHWQVTTLTFFGDGKGALHAGAGASE